MIDMSDVIKPKSDQLNADDLIGGSKTITITKVWKTSTEQPVSISFDGDDGKPYKPCKSMMRVMVFAWGPDASKYIGRSMTLYRDPKVKWAGMEVGGIRISHMSHIDKALTMSLTATKQSRQPFTVQPLTVETVDVSAEVAEGDASAAKGTDAFKAWAAGLSGLPANKKAEVGKHKARWLKIAEEADNANKQDEDIDL